MWRSWLNGALGAALALVALAGCAQEGSPSSEVPTASQSDATADASIPTPPSFSADEVAADVAVDMRSECSPSRDELLCSVVDFDGITFADGVLAVTTTLDADAADDAAHVCSFFEEANMSHDGALRGIDSIDMLSADGTVLASCEPNS